MLIHHDIDHNKIYTKICLWSVGESIQLSKKNKNICRQINKITITTLGGSYHNVFDALWVFLQCGSQNIIKTQCIRIAQSMCITCNPF